MWCSACGAGCRPLLCDRCRVSCVAAKDYLADGVYVRSAFLHEGAARKLVHSLKYEGSVRAAAVLADAVAELVGADTSALIPVPRVLMRRWKYGVDPALVLARAVGARTGIPVVRALRPPVVARTNAGAPRRRRSPPAFRLRVEPPAHALLIDDVVTTGRTVKAAASATGAITRRAVSATTAHGMTSLTVTSEPGGT